MDKLKHVDKPTNLITANTKRIDPREGAFARAARGDYGPAVQKAWARLKERDPVTDAIRDVISHMGSIRRNPVATVRAPIPEEPAVLSRHMKGLGYFLKADIVRICRLPKSAIYTHDRNGNPIDIDYKYAIAIVVQKDQRTVNASQGYDWIADSLSFQAYARVSLIAETMADYVRRLGYAAVAQSQAAGYSVLMPPLLLWAGIGEVSRAGIILSPFLGLSFKAAAVLTDLPLAPDKPIDFGLQDFCRRCKRCAQMCPSKAILPGDKVIYNGYETWKLNEERCASFSMLNRQGIWCNRCVKVCPWTQPNTWLHRVVRRAAPPASLARTIAIKGDQLFGHTEGKEDEKWWFDLEYADGFLRIPSLQDNRRNQPQ
jgi:reductive dehalogenase